MEVIQGSKENIVLPDKASQTVRKIIEINPYMLGTMVGGAADCQLWHRNLGIKCRLHELAKKRRVSVIAASKQLANILYSYRGIGLSIGTMITGWDEKSPGLYYVDSESARLKGNWFSVGSGYLYAYGILDVGYRFEMSFQEDGELARRPIYHATFRDGASGCFVSGQHHFYRRDNSVKKALCSTIELHNKDKFSATPAGMMHVQWIIPDFGSQEQQNPLTERLRNASDGVFLVNSKRMLLMVNISILIQIMV